MTHNLPPIVSRAQWQAARDRLLEKEKSHTRAGDALAAERRRLPMVEITKSYSFDCVTGKSRLLDLFEGRRQLVLYHFMFAPDMPGWPTAVCEGCSWYVDNIGNLSHLHARDTSLVLVSRAPLPNILEYKKRMGWAVPWASSFESDFNLDFGVSGVGGERFRNQNLPARWRPRLSHVLDIRPRRRGFRQFLDVSRHHTSRPAGELGRFARRLAAIGTLCVVAPPRRVRR